MIMATEQISYPCTIMRGGTSRAVFFHEKDLPPIGPERDYVLERAIGKPDKLEIDGLGGGQVLTSKVAIVGPPSVMEADIDYTFGQVLINDDGIDYSANCGNIAAAVGPFAVDAGLVKAVSPETVVRIHNTNTRKIFSARVPVLDGLARIKGDYAMAGIPGTGAEIVLDVSNTLGAITGKLLPTGKICEEIVLCKGDSIHASVCDAGIFGVFVRAEDLGLSGSELPREIEGNPRLLSKIAEIKNRVAERAGLVDKWQKADPQMMLPFVAIVAPPADYDTSEGQAIAAGEHDLRSRVIVQNICHPSYGGILGACTAACAAIPGSIPNSLLISDNVTLRIAHPRGVMPVKAEIQLPEKGLEYTFTGLGYSRTARIIMEGKVFIPVPDRLR